MSAPGWYPDGHGQTRYWDGASWSDQVAPQATDSSPQYVQQQAAPPAYGQPYGQPGVVLPPGYELKKQKRFYKRVWFWLVVIPVVLVIIVIAAIASAANKAVNNPHTVVYSITGDGTKATDITYLKINGDGTSGEEQANNAALPWSKTVTGKGDFSEYSLVGQAGDGNSISCEITVDGNVKAKQTSTGQFAVVTCSANGS